MNAFVSLCGDFLAALSVWEWAWMLANLITGIDYLIIPLCLIYWNRGQMDVSGLKPISWLFAVFIVSCGIHHIQMAPLVLLHPVSGVSVVINLIMVIVSTVAASVLVAESRKIRSTLRFLYWCLENRRRIRGAFPELGASKI